ncbi:hypothetical protein B0H14DRAFT_2749291 [Mycena olivaceomarginata]|nr:hypothetical protein B0H14DRAFT_2749291 [Mycena olivaceomarginata]
MPPIRPCTLAGYYYIMRGRKNADHLRDLYAEVESFFTGYTNEINATAPNDDMELPTYYDIQWGHFSRGVDVVDRLLDYLNKHYGRRKHGEGNKDVMTVKNLEGERVGVPRPALRRQRSRQGMSRGNSEYPRCRGAKSRE